MHLTCRSHKLATDSREKTTNTIPWNKSHNSTVNNFWDSRHQKVCNIMEVNPSEGLGPSHMTHAQREWDGRIQACTRRKNYKILQSGTINDGVVNVFAACTRRRNYKILQLRNAIGKDADTAGSQIKP